MGKRGYTMLLTASMILAVGMPMTKGEAANVPVTGKEIMP